MGKQRDFADALRGDGRALTRSNTGTRAPAHESRSDVISETYTKLSAARTRLILERPFIGSLVMHLPLIKMAAERCPTVATDARALYFNSAYIAELTLTETQFVLAHEALHCALGHFARRSHRIKRRWDVACDHAVNLILIQDGMRPPAEALVNEDYRGLTAEEIYPLIPADTREVPLDRHLFEMGAAPFADSRTDSPPHQRFAEQRSKDGRTEVGGANERGEETGAGARSGHRDEFGVLLQDALSASPHDEEALVQCWQSRLASAAQSAMRAGRLSDSLARSLEHLIQPRVPWRTLLARFFLNVARDDYSFQRSSRREGDALLPRLASGEVLVIIALDTSGSIGEEEMREFTSEIDALKGQVRANLVLHTCDDRLSPDGPWRFAPWEEFRLPKTVDAGGGTRFTPVFEWIERERISPDLLIYFTDGQGEFPAEEPPYPVMWLVKGRASVPWGERIQLN